MSYTTPEQKNSIKINEESIDLKVNETSYFGKPIAEVSVAKNLRKILPTLEIILANLAMRMPVKGRASALALLFQKGAENLVMGVNEMLLRQHAGLYNESRCFSGEMPDPESGKGKQALFVCNLPLITYILDHPEIFDSPTVALSIDETMNPRAEDGEPVHGIVFAPGGPQHEEQRGMLQDVMRSDFTPQLLATFREKIPQLVDGMKSEEYIEVGAYLHEAMSDLVATMIFGESENGDSETKETKEKTKKEVLKVVQDGFNLGNEAHYLGKKLTWLKALLHKRAKSKVFKKLDALIDDEVAKVQANESSSLIGQLGLKMLEWAGDEVEIQKKKAELVAICFHLTFAAYDTTTNMMTYIVKELADEKLFADIKQQVAEEGSGKPAASYAAISDLITASLVDGLSTFMTARMVNEDHQIAIAGLDLHLHKGDEIYVVLKAALQALLKLHETKSENDDGLRPYELYKLVTGLSKADKATIWNIAFGGEFDQHNMQKRTCLGRGAATAQMAEFAKVLLEGTNTIQLDPERPYRTTPGATSQLELPVRVS